MYYEATCGAPGDSRVVPESIVPVRYFCVYVVRGQVPSYNAKLGVCGRSVNEVSEQAGMSRRLPWYSLLWYY